MRRMLLRLALAATVLCVLLAAPAPTAAQENFCGITPESARSIAKEIMRQAGYAYDSATAAYYISVLAPRLSPFYVVYFARAGKLIGEIEVDLCGRQDTPHPGIQYAPESEVLLEQLLVEPDDAFRVLRDKVGKEAVFGSRVFPYGLTATTDELSAIDFWWMLLDENGRWHYMSKLGRIRQVGAHTDSSQTPSVGK